MDTQVPLLVGMQHIRLQRHFNFGEHDPIFMPQPFDLCVTHLALIRKPSLEGEHKILWALPDKSEFEPIDGFKLTDVPIGHLPAWYSEGLNHSLMTFTSNLDSQLVDPASSSNQLSMPPLCLDLKIKEY
ncbi:hypothetical protein BDP27DRAFT_1425270 [Rhodocollybia butyracea]|uniref:Uncharacterized protein n=1 Tax=Rhodocollybia butyracea TaxID=206335 RepID=A0A9P5PLZ9_9AGAR|nr:hypothetical protein BDP27DRAFT_1425270 [Rhodocollybia butyracea]